MLYDALFGPSGRERDVAAGGDIFTDDSEWRSPVKSVSLHLTRAFIGKNAHFSGLSLASED